jgi:hypothetical protein
MMVPGMIKHAETLRKTTGAPHSTSLATSLHAALTPTIGRVSHALESGAIVRDARALLRRLGCCAFCSVPATTRFSSWSIALETFAARVDQSGPPRAAGSDWRRPQHARLPLASLRPLAGGAIPAGPRWPGPRSETPTGSRGHLALSATGGRRRGGGWGGGSGFASPKASPSQRPADLEVFERRGCPRTRDWLRGLGLPILWRTRGAGGRGHSRDPANLLASAPEPGRARLVEAIRTAASQTSATAARRDDDRRRAPGDGHAPWGSRVMCPNPDDVLVADAGRGLGSCSSYRPISGCRSEGTTASWR